ncbi:MAG: 50S ribosomal protein L4 [Opitutales bacterium]
MKIKFYGIDGVCSGERDYDIPTFEGDRGLQVLKEVVLAYQANLRQGNACTKTRGEVHGSGKKPFRQKGTGMARQGEKRSPLARGGGVVFGPKPRDFSVQLNRKEKRLALQRALFDAVVEGKLLVLEALKDMEAPKTAVMAEVLNKVVENHKSLVIDSEFSQNQLLSLRNLNRIFSVDAHSVNAFDLVRFQKVVMTDRALASVLQRIQA